MNTKTPPTRRPAPPAEAEVAEDLRRVRRLTRRMREAEKRVADAGRERRILLRDLREKHVPFRALAEAAGTTEQAIYKDLRWGRVESKVEAPIPSPDRDSEIA